LAGQLIPKIPGLFHWKLREIEALNSTIIKNIPASIPLKAGSKMYVLDLCYIKKKFLQKFPGCIFFR